MRLLPTASLQDQTFAQLSLQSNAESRRIVQNALKELGLKFVPSNGNFCFFMRLRVT